MPRWLQIAERDLSFALELLEGEAGQELASRLPAGIRGDLIRHDAPPSGREALLVDLIVRDHPNGMLRNELGVLSFATAFLRCWHGAERPPKVITPRHIRVILGDEETVSVVINGDCQATSLDSLYEPPSWCMPEDHWRFQLGYLMRFILSGQRDFTRPVPSAYRRDDDSKYRPTSGHWYQRLYGLFNGQPAFGDNWLPITDWVEEFLLALLRWPGCQKPREFDWVEHGIQKAIEETDKRIDELKRHKGRSTNLLILPLVSGRPLPQHDARPLVACVVQTAVPAAGDFKSGDLALNGPEIRRRHRNHLSAAIAAVERMLALRETQKGQSRGLDWLILPELAVHPDDVHTHLIPFARAHRAIVLAGLTYEQVAARQPLANSALWVIPEWSVAHGLQIRTRRQGKGHLAPSEQAFNSDSPLLQGFRPCQWLVGYQWSRLKESRPVWLTAAVCYDATDIGLAADLRSESDVLAIPALNKDVKTFDQMALALHYHMFQLVVVANNGEYGGSNAYWPRMQEVQRQVFHTHGQQASIAFFEIDDIHAYLSRRQSGRTHDDQWKCPPAGTKP